MAETAHHRIRIKDNREEPSGVKRFFMALVLPSVLFGPGLLADSAAMQWAGFVALIFTMLLAIIASSYRWLTIDEARQKLDEIESKRRTR